MFTMGGYDSTTAVYDTVSNTTSVGSPIGVWTIVSLVLAVVGGIVYYFLIVKPNKKLKNKVLDWFLEFFDFKKLVIEDILKITYIILALFITLASFDLIAQSFFIFILVLILGNLVVRILYEMSLMLILVWKNTNDINKKLK